MPLPDYTAHPVQAPADAGVGLHAVMLEQRSRRPPSEWPADWWQRDYDWLLEPHGPNPVPLTGRQLTLPPPP